MVCFRASPPGGFRACCAGIALAACATTTLPGPGLAGPNLPEIRMAGAALDSRALAADLALHMPEEAEQLVRGLQRAAFAASEGRRLGIEPDERVVAQSLADALAEIHAGLQGGQNLEEWARDRYGRSLAEVQSALGDRIRRNQLYQLVLRAECLLVGRLRMHVFQVADEAEGEEIARKLRAGAHPRVLLEEGPRPPWEAEDGAWPPLPVFLPPPLAELLKGAYRGTVAGPVRLEGDAAWWVVRVAEVLPPTSTLPPRSILLEGLRSQPVLPLEARAWFEEMASRYTSKGRLPNIRERPPFVPRRQD